MYLHLLLMAFYILRPVIPYIEYTINKDYIASYLCVNRDKPLSGCEGKCYLEKQIKETAESNNSPDTNTNKKVQNEEVNEFLSAHSTILKVFESNVTHAINQETIFSSRTVSAIFIPPQIYILS